jgi:lysozyme family protein
MPASNPSPAPAPLRRDARFAPMLAFVLRWECVYDPKTGHVIAENVPGDGGGLTKYGIDSRSHPGVDVRNLTHDQAADIYHRDYYLASRAAELPDGLAHAHFDAAVNVGASRACKLLQEALEIKVDGGFGPKTLAAALVCSPAIITTRMIDLRAEFYRDLGSRSRYRIFLTGWLNRLAALRQFIAVQTAPPSADKAARTIIAAPFLAVLTAPGFTVPQLPDPEHYATVGWVVVIVAGLAMTADKVMDFWAKHIRGNPPVATLDGRLRHVEHEIRLIETRSNERAVHNSKRIDKLEQTLEAKHRENQAAIAAVKASADENGRRGAAIEAKTDLLLGLLHNIDAKVDRNNELRRRP